MASCTLWGKETRLTVRTGNGSCLAECRTAGDRGAARQEIGRGDVVAR